MKCNFWIKSNNFIGRIKCNFKDNDKLKTKYFRTKRPPIQVLRNMVLELKNFFKDHNCLKDRKIDEKLNIEDRLKNHYHAAL